MDSEDPDSENAMENLYKQEFELLKSMFEYHFSSEVIAGVLEDCDGDVNLAVDTLTKIEDSSSAVTLPLDTSTKTENSINAVTECHNNNMATTNVNMSLQAHSYAAASQAPLTAIGLNTPETATGINTPATTTEVTTHATAMGVYAPAVRYPPRTRNFMPKIDYWTDQMKKIITDYNEGSRVLVVMRGAPGSGKSYLARIIVESTVGTKNPNNCANHIFSSDDHMQINGRYHYNVNRLDEVHMKNQTRVYKAVNEGRSPVIVDNTNMKTWEMFAYVRDAVVNGYIIEVVEPSNPWSKNPSQLAKRNSHGVPKDKIQNMLQKYEGSHTGESLLKYFKLCYPKGLEPPVKRNIPAFHKQTPGVLPALHKQTSSILPPEKYVTGRSVNQLNQEYQDSNCSSSKQASQDLQNVNHNIKEIPCTMNVNHISKVDESNYSNNQTQQQQIKIGNNLDEMLKVEVEWDNGDGWETPLANRVPKMDAAALLLTDPKPQRSKTNELSDQYIQPSMLHDDWTKNLMYMTPLHEGTASAVKETSQIQVHTEITSTLVEIKSPNYINDEQKTMIGTSIDVSEITNHNKKEPVLSNHNKSTISHKSFLTGRCEHEEKHFVTMRKMFKSVPRPVLKEIFDNCAGDVYWACSIVVDGIQHNNLQAVNSEESDSEEEHEVDCQCEYNQVRFSLLPETSTEIMLPVPGEKSSPSSTPTYKKKVKKEKLITDDSLILKRQIENTIVIPDNHYSQHYLNMRKPRHDNKSPNDEKASTSGQDHKDTNQVIIPQNVGLSESTTSVQSNSTRLPHSSAQIRTFDTSRNDIPSTSSANHYKAIPSTSGTNNLESTGADDEDEDEDDDTLGSDDEKSGMGESEIFTINMGMDFVRKLDQLCGRHDFEYPEGVKPILSIPAKVLHDLSLLWVESITYQLDNNHTQTDEMIKQDEEFARQVELQLQLEAEEAENYSEESEDDVEDDPQGPSEPNFKEIMDTELALAIYEKEVKEEWKNKEPQDMAAQMTRKKLYELFPEVAKETLSEMLIAHGNSFDNTVEILLISTGQGHYLDQTNGINKFVMEKENENKDKLLLEEQNAKLCEEEYPYLFKPGKEQTELSMDTVNEMRDKAEKHKNARDIYFRKAKWYYDRKKLAEASHYSRIAALHTARYDTANNFAAAALVQYHSNIHPEANVIDLHFLRVPEAENSLDLFIDDRLRKMRLNPEAKPIVLHIITGRGKHSPGRPRVKPAIMKRLKARGLTFRQQNPGLLDARLKPTHLLLEELLNS